MQSSLLHDGELWFEGGILNRGDEWYAVEGEKCTYDESSGELYVDGVPEGKRIEHGFVFWDFVFIDEGYTVEDINVDEVVQVLEELGYEEYVIEQILEETGLSR